MSTLAAFSKEDPSIAHLRYQDNGLTDIGTFSMHGHVIPDTAVLQFIGDHKRPVVRLKGMVSKLTPAESDVQQAQAYGIDEITFLTSPGSTDDQPRMMCDYVFTNEQIKALVDKGLYEDAFAIPTEYLTSNELRVPMNVSLTVAAPDLADGQTVLLYNIHDLRTGEMDVETSGFDLVKHCESVLDRQVAPVNEYRRDTPQQQAGADMFADVAYEERAVSREAARDFDDEFARSRDANVPFVERLQALAPNEDLEFIEVYEDMFPTEDFVPEDVRAKQRELEEALKNKETSPVLRRFYEQRQQAGRDEPQPSGDALDELENANADFDLSAEDVDELNDVLGRSVADFEAGNVADFDAGEDTPHDEVADEVAEREEDVTASHDDVAAERDDEDVIDTEIDVDGNGDLFADEDFDEDAADDSERERRERRRAVALSNDAVETPDESSYGKHAAPEQGELLGDGAQRRERERARQREARRRASTQQQRQRDDDGFSL